jgi:hypothetical protein
MHIQVDLNFITRREFLKLSGASLLALFALSSPVTAYAKKLSRLEDTPNTGRIVTNDVSVFDQPTLDGTVLKKYYKDLVLPITKITMGTGEPTYNKVWYEMNGEGYVHSGNVQPVEVVLNDIVTTFPATGQLAEVTVPFTDAVWNPEVKSVVAYRLYYSTTHWVVGWTMDSEGSVWYDILEDFYQFHYYVNGKHLRLLTADDVSPLSPDVPVKEKSIQVYLNDQIVVAYEGDTPVQMIRCSGGTKYYNHYMTPTGDFTTDYKRPSRHMVNGSKATATTYDLPGVPWVSFINEDGISFHGTYWHNDFGRPRSHGCINLPSEGAKWVYRWTLPEVPFAEQTFYKRPGTSVTVSKA